MKLVVYKGKAQIQSMNLGLLIKSTEGSSGSAQESDIFIGRAAQCQIQIPDQHFSRFICLLRIKKGKVYFAPLKSLGELAGLSLTEVNSGFDYLFSPYRLTLQGSASVVSSTVSSSSNSGNVLPLVPLEHAEEQLEQPLNEFSESAQGEINLEQMMPMDDEGFNHQQQVSSETTDNFRTHEKTIPAEEPFQLDLPPSEPSSLPPFPTSESSDLSNASSDSPNQEGGTRLIRDFITYELHVLRKGKGLTTLMLKKPLTVLGRNNDCDVVLEDPEVSAVHAHLILAQNRLVIKDQQSSNGVYINGQRKNEALLVHGDQFEIGGFQFHIKTHSEFLAQEAASLMPVELGEKTQEVVLPSTSGAKGSADTSNSWWGQLQIKIAQMKSGPSGQGMNPRRLIMLVVLVAGLGLLLTEDEPAPAPEEQSTPAAEVQSGTGAATPVPTGSVSPESLSTAAPGIKVLTAQEMDYLNSHYALATTLLEKGDYVEAIKEADLVRSLDSNYKDIQSIYTLAQEGLAKIEEQERLRKLEEEKIIRDKKIAELVEKIQNAILQKNLIVAQGLIDEVIQIDPDHHLVLQYRTQLEELEQKKREEEELQLRKQQERQRQVEQLMPGKNFYLQKEWYKALIKLKEFLLIKGLDEDLAAQASTLVKECQEQIDLLNTPLLVKAREFYTGGDLKNSYEEYLKVLKNNPGDEEANLKAKEIKDVLEEKVRKIYREALVVENLSNFEKAKEKYQEVLQSAPSDSEYYQKAYQKLQSLFIRQ